MADGLKVWRKSEAEFSDYHRTAANGVDSFEIVDTAPTPAEQAELAELGTELEAPSAISPEGAEALRVFFDTLNQRLATKRAGAMALLRLVLAVGYSCGSLRGQTLQSLAEASLCSKQALHATVTKDLLADIAAASVARASKEYYRQKRPETPTASLATPGATDKTRHLRPSALSRD